MKTLAKNKFNFFPSQRLETLSVSGTWQNHKKGLFRWDVTARSAKWRGRHDSKIIISILCMSHCHSACPHVEKVSFVSPLKTLFIICVLRKKFMNEFYFVVCCEIQKFFFNLFRSFLRSFKEKWCVNDPIFRLYTCKKKYFLWVKIFLSSFFLAPNKMNRGLI